ncbi:uncharacterized protein K02A2.6-like [Amphibalanus amphitrite]|uniref:uncharacterized protein K02A2.6-like n=1 Tax=Amphibalanus amphitrite TaxID=1232801 RepID=UPI001C9018CC|nr:uncharacterized protein K02A2.6-like [Amphibalanus amphitrite]
MGHVRDACSSGRLDLVAEDEFDEPSDLPAHEDGEVYQLFYESAGTGRDSRRPPLYVDVKLNGRPIRTELDTGAAVSVCSEAEFLKLWPKGGPVLKPSALKLQTYGGDALSVLGEVLVCVQYGSVSVNLPLVIVKGNGPCLFGRDWLSHFRLDWAAICRVSGVTADPQLHPLLKEFPKVFDDQLGCFTGEPVSIVVDPDATPRFFKASPVPLAYRQRVDEELERQIRLGLLEEVRDIPYYAAHDHSEVAGGIVFEPAASYPF